jgi:uncharacterized protein (DUF58 family)
MISDFINLEERQEQDIWLKRLSQRCDMIFISINDPADKTLPSIGRLGVCSPQHEKLVVNTTHTAGRAAYAEQWNTNRAHLHQVVTRFGIPLIEMTTEDDVKKELWMSLKRLSKRSGR